MADIIDYDIDDNEFNTNESEVKESKSKLPPSNIKRKGRGFEKDNVRNRLGAYEPNPSVEYKPEKSVEGYILFVTGVHEEATEEDVYDKFADFGEIKNLHLNLDRRTGFLKGYALLEFSEYENARKAIQDLNGKEILGQKIKVDWAFVKPRRI